MHRRTKTADRISRHDMLTAMMDSDSVDDGIESMMKLMNTPNDRSTVTEYDKRSPVNMQKPNC
jgi:hypothetical protein